MKKKSLILLIAVLAVTLVVTTACSKKEEKTKDPYDYLVLVNKYTKLPDDWEKNVKLVSAKNAWDEDIQLEESTYKDYKKLEKDLKDDGITIVLDSVYRSVEDQQKLWDDWSKDPEKGIEYVKKFVAVPGYSEHHTGLAVDIVIKKDGKLIEENEDMIKEKEIFSKIHKKLAKHGFILRYPKGKDKSTGYTYEPWHFRYIKDKELAKEIMSEGLTFEEYLNSIKDIKTLTSAEKYQIVNVLKNELENKIYKGKIDNSRYNITKIYSDKEVKESENLKSLNVGKKDIAFEVTCEILPKKDANIDELKLPNGTYDKKTGWVTNLSRVGILKHQKNGSYKLDNFGTGW